MVCAGDWRCRCSDLSRIASVSPDLVSVLLGFSGVIQVGPDYDRGGLVGHECSVVCSSGAMPASIVCGLMFCWQGDCG